LPGIDTGVAVPIAVHAPKRAPEGHLDRDEQTVTTRVGEQVKAIRTGVEAIAPGEPGPVVLASRLSIGSPPRVRPLVQRREGSFGSGVPAIGPV
jgi:hypothetical protein